MAIQTGRHAACSRVCGLYTSAASPRTSRSPVLWSSCRVRAFGSRQAHTPTAARIRPVGVRLPAKSDSLVEDTRTACVVSRPSTGAQARRRARWVHRPGQEGRRSSKAGIMTKRARPWEALVAAQEGRSWRPNYPEAKAQGSGSGKDRCPDRRRRRLLASSDSDQTHRKGGGAASLASRTKQRDIGGAAEAPWSAAGWRSSTGRRCTAAGDLVRSHWKPRRRWVSAEQRLGTRGHAEPATECWRSSSSSPPQSKQTDSRVSVRPPSCAALTVRRGAAIAVEHRAGPHRGPPLAAPAELTR